MNIWDAAKYLQIVPEDVCALCEQLTVGAEMMQFGRGFYCGRLKDASGASIFVVNGLYTGCVQRLESQSEIKYFVVKWDVDSMAWS